MLKKLLILTIDKFLATEVEQRLVPKSITTEIFSDGNDVARLVSTKVHFDCFFIDDTTDKRNISTILGIISRFDKYKKTPVFLGVNNLDFFIETLDEYPSIDLNVINLPASEKEITTRISQKLDELAKSAQDNSSKYSVNTSFMKVIIECTEQALSEMTSDDTIVHDRPQLGYDFTGENEIGLRAQIKINSHFFKGSYFISFPTKTYLKMYKEVVGEDSKKITDENYDLAKEIANIIYGRAKSILNADEEHLSMAIPCHYDVTVSSPDIVIIIPYKSKYGTFFVKIAPNLF